MRLPAMRYQSRIGQSIQSRFAGYRHTMDAGDGDLWDMKNLSSRYAPLLSPRLPRRTVCRLTAPNGLYAMEQLAWVDGGTFYYDGVARGSVSDGHKRFASLGNRIIILPDMCYYDTKSEEFGSLGRSVTLTAARLKDGFYAGEFAEANTLWSSEVNFSDYFRTGDAVKLSGLQNEDNNRSPIIREISEDGHELRFYENVFTLDYSGRVEEKKEVKAHAQLTGTRYMGTTVVPVVNAGGEDTLPYSIDQTTAISADAAGATEAVGKVFYQLTDSAVEGVRSSVYYTVTEASFSGNYLELTLSATRSMIYSSESNVTVAREVPEMDYMCANENRLWGCKGDTIYASKPGDPFNWNVFDGIASDSWTVDAGSPGEFTACCSYAGYPVFFKRDRIYKVYGTIPSNFELVASATGGVAPGSGESLAVAGETLWYLGEAGVTAYSGAMPAAMHEAFGTDAYRNAVGGSDGQKYYISMEGPRGWELFVYDTQQGMWHREDASHAIGFARTEDGLYMLASDGRLLLMDQESGETVEWMAEFGDFSEGELTRKGVSRLQLRLELDRGSRFRVEMNFDSTRRWTTVMNIVGERDRQMFAIPIVPRRADHWRLRLSGSGGCIVHSIGREYYKGGDGR